jgi:hypothetical protein
VRAGAWILACALLLGPQFASPQTPDARAEDDAVGESVSHVFATELGSGIYDLGGRTLQVYRFTWRKDLREAAADKIGLRFVLPSTFGFYDFKPIDVISEGPPKNIDSFSVQPGLELDIPLRDDWHVVPYGRVGFSVASSSVDGWLYSAGVRADRRVPLRGWESFTRTELAFARVDYRDSSAADDSFVRLRQGVDFSRGLGMKIRGYELELGLYGMLDVIVDPPTVPVADAEREPVQFEAGFTLATRPRVKIWRWDAPRIGFGYRLAGEISGWRLVFGAPF